MKRKSPKAVVDVQEGISLVHLNVGSGYLTYIQEDGEQPRVKNVVLEPKATEEG